MPHQFALILQAVQTVSNPSPSGNVLPDPSKLTTYASPVKRLLTSFEFYLGLEVLTFGIVVLIVEYLVLRTRNITAEDALKVYGVTLIIVGTLFIICTGFQDSQIAPAMGLFGTLGGYLLGRKTSETALPRPDDKEAR